ncbi:hypothetical protein H0H93_004252, partial [Arthromyces matolae]
VNVIVLAVLKGSELGWVCLGSCTADVLLMPAQQFNIMWAVQETSSRISATLDWSRGLNDNEHHFISHVIAFFAAPILNKNLVEHFEARRFCGFQIMTENIHSETHPLVIDTYVKDQAEHEYLFGALDHKADWE